MINIMKISTSLVLGLMISACSSSPADTTPATTNFSQVTSDEKSTANIEQHLAEWKEIRPSLERLVMIEAELKSLIKEIARMSAEQKKTMAVQEVAQETVVTPAPLPAPISASKEVPKVTPSYSKYALQVFTIDNISILDDSWQRWSKNHSATLMGHSNIYQNAEKNGISYYRIKINDFITKQRALDTCQQLKKEGGDCFLTNNVGQNF